MFRGKLRTFFTRTGKRSTEFAMPRLFVNDIEVVQDALRKTYTKMSFEDFCKRTDFTGDYAFEKFQTFQKGVNALTEFDAGTLSLILAPENR